jgi:DNA-binding transcriptional MerR regulator
LWTIGELSAQAALALSVGYDGQGNGQVREVPDLRTIRYYTTLGLVDRPTAMQGRTALYGRRHLLQLVAIKRLQARGRTLAELQRELLGRTDEELAALAQLPVVLPEEVQPARRSESFWSQPPAPPSPPEPREEAAPPSDLTMQGVRLSDDVFLLLSSARLPDNSDLEAIRSVAAPLLKLLEKRRLARPSERRQV